MSADARGPVAQLATDDIESPVWRTALAQVSDLKSLLGDGELSDDLAHVLAVRWNTSVRTVWRRARAYRREASVRAVMNRGVGLPREWTPVGCAEAVIQKTRARLVEAI